MMRNIDALASAGILGLVRQRRGLPALLMGAFLMWGCGSADSQVGLLEPVDPASIYGSLELNHHTAQLSLVKPYDTVRLATTVRTLSGAVWTPPPGFTGDTGVTTYVSSGPVATVSDKGLVTMIANGSATITASRQIGGITRTDQLVVSASAGLTPRAIHGLRMKPDSAKRAMGSRISSSGTTFSPVWLDAANTPVTVPAPGFGLYITSSDPSVLHFLNPRSASFSFRQPGVVKITVAAYVFDRALTDTFTFTVGPNITTEFSVTAAGLTNGDRRVICQGCYVTWINNVPQTIDVVFADSAQARTATTHPLLATQPVASGSGNIMAMPEPIPPVPPSTNFTVSRRTRRFDTPGKHRFTIEPLGITGTVVVKAF